MTPSLSQVQVAAFERDGYLAPVRVLDADALAELTTWLTNFEHETGEPIAERWRHKTHLVFPAVADLVRNRQILDAVEALLGPNILCWNTDVFIKESASKAYVSWHQDSTYWGLEPPRVVTAWVALTRSDEQSGAVRVLPRSHLTDQHVHVDTFATNNLLTRGQEIAIPVNEADAVTLSLEPGEMSLHHIRIVHGSGPNESQEPRVGIAIRYLPTSVRQRAGHDSATLVRGTDAQGNFELEPAPQGDRDPQALAYHRLVLARTAKIVNA